MFRLHRLCARSGGSGCSRSRGGWLGEGGGRANGRLEFAKGLVGLGASVGVGWVGLGWVGGLGCSLRSPDPSTSLRAGSASPVPTREWCGWDPNQRLVGLRASLPGGGCGAWRTSRTRRRRRRGRRPGSRGRWGCCAARKSGAGRGWLRPRLRVVRRRRE